MNAVLAAISTRFSPKTGYRRASMGDKNPNSREAILAALLVDVEAALKKADDLSLPWVAIDLSQARERVRDEFKSNSG